MWENKNGVSFFQVVHGTVDSYLYFAVQNADKLIRLMQMCGEVDVFPIFFAKIFGYTEVLKLIKHKITPKSKFCLLIVCFFARNVKFYVII